MKGPRFFDFRAILRNLIVDGYAAKFGRDPTAACGLLVLRGPTSLKISCFF